MTSDETLHGELCDGVTAAVVPVTLGLSASGMLRLRGPAIDREVALHDCRITPALGRLPRTLTLPDGATVTTRDLELFAAWEARWDLGRGARLVHGLEARWPKALAIALLSLAAAAAGWWWGIPRVASVVAFSLPSQLITELGDQALPIVEKRFGLEASGLDPARQDELGARFATLVGQAGSADFSYQLLIRASPAIGPNAFALPSGTIVLTDELVALAGSDDEILAVLAHEVAHVELRHGVRAALQDSSLMLLLGLFLGDVASTTSLPATLPAVLAQAGYSREFEREADRSAADWCRQHGPGTAPFAAILQRLGKVSEGGSGPAWLASHPEIAERVAALAR